MSLLIYLICGLLFVLWKQSYKKMMMMKTETKTTFRQMSKVYDRPWMIHMRMKIRMKNTEELKKSIELNDFRKKKVVFFFSFNSMI